MIRGTKNNGSRIITDIESRTRTGMVYSRLATAALVPNESGRASPQSIEFVKCDDFNSE